MVYGPRACVLWLTSDEELYIPPVCQIGGTVKIRPQGTWQGPGAISFNAFFENRYRVAGEAQQFSAAENIASEHISEAIQYCSLGRQLWT